MDTDETLDRIERMAAARTAVDGGSGDRSTRNNDKNAHGESYNSAHGTTD